MAKRKVFHLIYVDCVLLIWGLFIGSASAQDFGLSVHGGRLTKEKWEQAIMPGAEFADSTLFVVACSWKFSRLLADRLSLELEAQVGKHAGDQDHWEFNLPIVGFRWHRFPWDHLLATSFAWGIGPSYATQIPEIEIETSGQSSRWLIHWFGELAFGPPTASWETLLRLHHRSDGFGTVAEDGGSNAICAGVRYYF